MTGPVPIGLATGSPEARGVTSRAEGASLHVPRMNAAGPTSRAGARSSRRCSPRGATPRARSGLREPRDEPVALAEQAALTALVPVDAHAGAPGRQPPRQPRPGRWCGARSIDRLGQSPAAWAGTSGELAAAGAAGGPARPRSRISRAR
jgi:hypothetical protein